jgi:hypothetical protein
MRRTPLAALDPSSPTIACAWLVQHEQFGVSRESSQDLHLLLLGYPQTGEHRRGRYPNPAASHSVSLAVERAGLLTALQRSAISSPFIGDKFSAQLARDYRATFTLAMLLKDLRMAHGAADAVSVLMPMADLASREAKEHCTFQRS